MTLSKVFTRLLTLCLFLSVGNISPFWVKKIAVTNSSSETFFCAPYYFLRTKAVRATEPQAVCAEETIHLRVPRGRPLYSRILVVSKDIESLESKIEVSSSNPLDQSNSIKIGLGNTSEVTIAVTPNEGTLVQPTKNHIAHKMRADLRASVEKTSPHYKSKAHVTLLKDHISNKEREYMNRRQVVINSALSNYLGREIHSSLMPRISVCASGGGMRATLMALGALRGLNELGLLDTIRYCTGVSGGSWAIATWLASRKSLDEWIEQLSEHLSSIPSKKTLIRHSLREAMSLNQTKSLFGHRAGLTDLYSICLSKVILTPIEKNFRTLKWSDMHKSLHPAQHPLPICTAVTPQGTTRKHYDWLEFTPYDIRYARSDACIPNWAFMRKFRNGTSIDAMPEPWFGYMLGIWGSAFSISFADVITKAKPAYQNILPQALIERITSDYWGTKKHFAARIPNFTYGMPGIAGTKKPLLKMIDAGHGNNIGVAPLMHAGRDQDLLIIINAGTKPHLDFDWLYKMKNALQKRYEGIEFNVDKAAGTPVTFWPSSNPESPNIIHIALHPDSHFDADYNPRTDKTTHTLNFNYSKEKVHKLTGLTTFTVKKHATLIKEAIEHTITKKNKHKSWGEKISNLFK